MNILAREEDPISGSYIDGLLQVKDNEELVLERPRPRSRGLIECEKCNELISKKEYPDHIMAHDLQDGK